MGRRKHKESREQAAVMRFLELAMPDLYRCTIHVPNGGARSKAEGAIFKAMGVKAGVPDLLCFQPRSVFAGLALEMKSTGRKASSRLTDSQLDWRNILIECGWLVEAAAGFDEAREILERYRAMPRLGRRFEED